MKILLVSYSILPNTGGTSIVVENLARQFQRDEMLVLGESSIFRPKTLERSVSMPEFLYFPSRINIGGRGGRYLSWVRNTRIPALKKKIAQTIKNHKITHVVGVYPEPMFCLAACQVAKELHIPFSSYFHNTYVENINITDPKASEIQAEIFKNSCSIFVMSKGMQKFYEEKYNLQKFIPLVHTFDSYPDTQQMTGIPGINKKIYRLVTIGNFNESNLEATRRLVQAVKGNKRFELNFYTHVSPLLLQNRGLDIKAIQHRGFLDSAEQVHDELQKYDICILPHGFTGGYGEVEYRTIFPTRTIPFLLSGKPIFAHSPKGSFLNDFITENQCAELVDEASETAILEGLERICQSENYQQQLVTTAKQTAAQFYGPNVIETLKARL